MSGAQSSDPAQPGNSSNIVALFDTQTAAQPDAAALLDGRQYPQQPIKTHSFADLQRLSLAWADTLAQSGIGPGDRVLVALRVSPALYGLLLALWRLGAVAILPDPSAPRSQLDDTCQRLQPSAFVGIPAAHLLRLGYASVRRIPRHFSVDAWLPWTTRLGGNPTEAPPRDAWKAPADSPALITFTSGSTGRPKAACRSHGFLRAQYQAILGTLHLQPGDVDATTLPVFVLANLAAGVSTLLPPGDIARPGAIEPVPVLQAMQACGVTRASGSPAFFRQLCQGLNEMASPQLQHLHTGGAPVTPEMMLDYAQLVASGRSVTAVYGSTEAEPIAELPATELNETALAGPEAGYGLPAGRPLAAVRLRILAVTETPPPFRLTAAELEERCIGPGEIGEITVAGAHVLGGYLDGEGDEQTKLDVEGVRWHRTGDAGYLDAEGRLWLVGRVSAAVTLGGRCLYPFQLEYPLRAQPGVAAAAVLTHQGQACLVIEPKPGCQPDVEQLVSALPVGIPAQSIRLVKQIPLDRRHNAKIDYGALQALLSRP
ncbi:AMP-dependent synthetase [Natronospirillum operosum]|uniref:AMP-dependent synthetase n=1 Tax=Natronospirillum operosum TaxID=2759953 RepID=A0A4Z0WEQ2_9GAMM|nr:AMP-binding protein [Natronospirillum operosum]TGG95510.1 AMP-dependent synthetase [Natronospirillum operosum]